MIDEGVKYLLPLEVIHRQNMEAVSAPYKSEEFRIIRNHFVYGIDYRSYAAIKDDVFAGGLLVKTFGPTIDYTIPGVHPEYRTGCPLHRLIYQAMYDGALEGKKFFNWGGSAIEGMEGVRHFKKQWGTTEKEYRYYTWVNRDRLNLLTKAECLGHYKYFYVVPFNEMKGGGE
jgi:lipid II:glycine glycyltransferase (peptidoglycan interpeptide bridge formation enzyme)